MGSKIHAFILRHSTPRLGLIICGISAVVTIAAGVGVASLF